MIIRLAPLTVGFTVNTSFVSVSQVIPPRFLNRDARYPAIVNSGPSGPSGPTAIAVYGVLEISGSTGVMTVLTSTQPGGPTGPVEADQFFTAPSTSVLIGWQNAITVPYSLL